MSVNNGKIHDYAGQQYMSDFTRCTFYFPSNNSENNLRGLFSDKEVLLFNMEEKNHDIDVVISFPDNYDCVHYWKGKETLVNKSQKSHLTYHGSRKRKKATGEIHIVSNGNNPLKGKAPYTESHLASSSNIVDHPLPICRIELSNTPGSVKPQKNIINYFHTDTSKCFFNTIEVSLTKKGYLKSIAAPIPSNDPWRATFIHTSMHSFFLRKTFLRPGWYPQALALQTKTFELIIIATREYRNQSYANNSISYFHTKDYFREMGKRKVIEHRGGFFIDKTPNEPNNPEAKLMSDYLKKFQENY